MIFFMLIIINNNIQYYSAFSVFNPALSTVQLLPCHRFVSYQHTPQLPGEHNSTVYLNALEMYYHNGNSNNSGNYLSVADK